MSKYIIEIKYRIICILIVFFTFIPTLFVYKFYIIHFFLWINPKALTNSLNYFILTSITELFNVFYFISLFIIKYILYYFVYYHTVSFLALSQISFSIRSKSSNPSRYSSIIMPNSGNSVSRLSS